MVDIRSGDVLRGALPARALSLVQEWRRLHADELMVDWEHARQREALEYIAPLE